MANPIGEVIAASTTCITAQCIEIPRPDAVTELPDPPAFGSFVRIGAASDGGQAKLPDDFDPFVTSPALSMPDDDAGRPAIYGVVYHAETGALEAGRPLTAFGLNEAELRREQPHIYELLATRFSAVLIAHAGPDGSIRPYLPARPPRPHSRVFTARDDETHRLTERLDYLRPLLTGNMTGATFPAEELVAALLRNAWRARGGDEAFLLRAGRELAALLPSDYDRLRAIVARVVG
jgi:hypothetical protein